MWKWGHGESAGCRQRRHLSHNTAHCIAVWLSVDAHKARALDDLHEQLIVVPCSVFMVSTHEAMQPGTLALNALQRKVGRAADSWRARCGDGRHAGHCWLLAQESRRR